MAASCSRIGDAQVGANLQMRENYIKHAATGSLESRLDVFRKDALDREVFGVVKVRGLGVLEGLIAKGELGALNVKVLIERRQTHFVPFLTSASEWGDSRHASARRA